MNWVIVWETDDNRDMWCLDIERQNEERYWELASIFGEDWALEEMDEKMRARAVRQELREEKLRRASLILEIKVSKCSICLYVHVKLIYNIR